jgi:hypothetical protein
LRQVLKEAGASGAYIQTVCNKVEVCQKAESSDAIQV